MTTGLASPLACISYSACIAPSADRDACGPGYQPFVHMPQPYFIGTINLPEMQTYVCNLPAWTSVHMQRSWIRAAPPLLSRPFAAIGQAFLLERLCQLVGSTARENEKEEQEENPLLTRYVLSKR
eukprot:scaffold143079_cov18-Tisochrysis_lutea.AAC.1